jgi:uncharacterized protein YbaR (Trm112 family)
MINSEIRSILCCPACRGDITDRPEASELNCPSCGFTYPLVEDIPVMFPGNVKEDMADMFNCYWGSVEKTEIYVFVQHYRPENLDVVLDAGCGNGRSFEPLPIDPIKVGMNASLNLPTCTKKRGHADFLVCGELEHLPFKSSVFGTVLSCRVLQQFVKQEKAVLEILRVTRDKGDAIFELYNTLNLKTIYKNIRTDLCLRRVFNASFGLLLKSMLPFADKIPTPVLQL